MWYYGENDMEKFHKSFGVGLPFDAGPQAGCVDLELVPPQFQGGHVDNRVCFPLQAS